MLLERDRLLDVLQAASRKAGAGHGTAVLVEGEAGIGKTSLLQEFADRAGSSATILWGWCEALFTPRPLGPLYDMARGLGPRMRAMLDQTVAPERLFPALVDTLEDAQQPTILIFEDVHWADNATFDLLKYLGRRISLLRSMVIMSGRNDEIGAGHLLSSVLGDLPASNVTRLKLDPLSAEAVMELAGPKKRSGEELYRVTGGNPFFVTELLGSGDIDGNRIPASIRDAVWSRLSRVAAGEREVLEMMSIVPGSVDDGLIQALAGPDAAELVDRSVARGLLRRDGDGHLTFRHELARAATLERLSPSLQRSLHAKVGAALASLPGAETGSRLARRVHHAASAEDSALVVLLAPQAAAQASRLGAHQQAASFLALGLKHAATMPPAVAAQFFEDWAYEASLALRDYESIIEAHHRAIELWRTLDATDHVSLNLRRLSRLHWRRGQGEDAERFCDLAVDEAERAGSRSELAMAYSTRSQFHMLHYRFDEAIDWGHRAIALADELGEVETRTHALNNVGTSLLFSGDLEGQPMMEESLGVALRHGFHDHAARAYTNFAEHAVRVTDFVLAERLLSEGVAFATKHDLDATTQYLLGRQAQLRMEQGRFREAETIAQRVTGIERLPVVMHLPALTVLGRVRARLGEPDAVRLLKQALDEGLPTGEAQRVVPVRFALTEAAWLADDRSGARTQLDALAAIGPESFRPPDLGELAVWWRRCEMPDAWPVDLAALPRPRGRELAGDHQGAAAEWKRLGLPYEAALSLMQVTGADVGRALAQAATLLDEMEARPAALLARRLAQRSGVADQLPKVRRGPYAASRQHPLGLTANEQQVLALIIQGKSNKEVARDLSRSPRTVEHQVSAVLAKFNAVNRMEVLLRLRAEPWLATSTAAAPA